MVLYLNSCLYYLDFASSLSKPQTPRKQLHNNTNNFEDLGSPTYNIPTNDFISANPIAVKSDSSTISPDDWRLQVVELDLSSKYLRKLQSMDYLINLKRANFSDNELARIIGLDYLINLEELILEDNRLSKIEGLNNLLNLQKLDLGKNRIRFVLY